MTIDEAKKKAQQVLSDNFIIEYPINIRELARKYGLYVEEKTFPSEYSHISGFIMQDNGVPHLVINASDSINRQNFTIAHELGHWLLHRKKLEEDPKLGILFRIPLGKLNADPLEKQANAFAANLLVPTDVLKQYLADGAKPKDLPEIFGVSEDVIGFRLKHVRFPQKQSTKK